MKKIYLIGILLCCIGMLFAQMPENRTVKTIIVDALGQLPAGNVADYNKIIKEIGSTGEDGVLQLVDMMSPPGKGQNAPIEYALSGLSYYVSAEGQESARLTTSNAYLKVLDRTNEREIKAFIIRQLEITGKNEAVGKLSGYLGDPALSGPASRALAAIGGKTVVDALLSSLPDVTDNKSKADIVLALGDIQDTRAEAPLRNLLKSGDENLEKTVLYALSRTGTKISLPDLALAADRAGYTMENTGANDAYIALIKRVLNQGDVKDAEKATNQLMAKATKAGKVQSRGAALQILMAANPAKATQLLQKALKDTDRTYRNMALTYASEYADNTMYKVLLKDLAKSDTETKTDIIDWFGQLYDKPVNKDEVTSVALPVLLNLTNDADINVKSAAAFTLVKSQDSRAIPVLASLLSDASPEVVAIGRQALASFNGNIDSEVVKVLPSVADNGKIAALELLAMRKSTDNISSVLLQIEEGSPQVKIAALKALKDVVSEKDLNTLYAMLEYADKSAVEPIQQAIIVAISSRSEDWQVNEIISRVNRTDKSKQPLYYAVLASTGDSKALTILSEAFDRSDMITKNMAFEALLGWKGNEVADKLYAICRDGNATDYSDRALTRYIQLASDMKLTGENRRLLLSQAMDVAKTNTQKNAILKSLGQTNTFLGLLLAGEYLDQKEVQQSAANAVMTIALANKSFSGKNVKDLLNKVVVVLDNPDADYQKQAIRKHLAEMPDDEGFISIFNGEDLTGWKGLVKNPVARAKMNPAELSKEQKKADEQMLKDWKAEDNAIVYYGTGYNNLCTDKQYGDIEMYIDWMLDPNGKEPDGGIYLRGTPQVQIWDISRTNAGAQVGSGGLYNNKINPSTPSRVADNKLGEWNTFYIKMIGDRVTVKLNGETVVDNVILENFWDSSQPVPVLEQLELQAHGCRVYYKNIYVKELERPEPFKLSEEEQKEGFKVLFDGTNMHQWTGNTVDYILEDGCISMHPSNRFGGNLYTKDEYGNFVYRFEFQLTPGANNGVGIRAEKDKDAAYYGMEIQILDHDNPIYKNITPFQVHGSVYGIIAAKRAILKPAGEWNYEEIIADGNHIKVTLNGEVILEGNIKDAVKDGTPDKKQHPGLFNEKGCIGFLGHGSPVKFRNIRIKELK